MRNQASVDKIARGPSVQQYLSSKSLTFVIVPDNTVPDAYHEAARDSQYIIHVASPLPTMPGDLVSQAVAGNKAILEAAQATTSVKRVVITSSTSSIHPFERLFPTHPVNQAIMSGRSDKVPALTADTTVPTPAPVSVDAPGEHRYTNSKIAAANFVSEYAASDAFKTSHFSIVNIKPGWIFGPDELATNKQEAFKGSNFILSWLFMDMSLGPLLGLPADEHPPMIAETVHLTDVVEAHVKALGTDKVRGNYLNFLLCSDGPTGPIMMDAVDIVKRDLPEEVAEGKIPFAGKLGRFLIDNTINGS